MQDGIRKALNINNLKMERDRLIGASMHGSLGTFAHGLPGSLTIILNIRRHVEK